MFTWCQRTGSCRFSLLKPRKWKTTASTTRYGRAYFLSRMILIRIFLCTFRVKSHVFNKCNSFVLNPTFDLATVGEIEWRASDDFADAEKCWGIKWPQISLYLLWSLNCEQMSMQTWWRWSWRRCTPSLRSWAWQRKSGGRESHSSPAPNLGNGYTFTFQSPEMSSVHLKGCSSALIIMVHQALLGEKQPMTPAD